MKYLLFLSTVAFLFSCDVRRKDKLSDDKAHTIEILLKDSTTVSILDTTFNFGKITDGEKVEYSYRFVNSGTKPLVVTNATASCGCTVPQRPEHPVMPGDTGYIKVVFDSKNRSGEAHKTISVFSNARPEFPTLLLNGEVVKK